MGKLLILPWPVSVYFRFIRNFNSKTIHLNTEEEEEEEAGGPCGVCLAEE